MTEAKSNIWGRYSENDIRIIREENRILEMRWEVFEGLYDKTRRELEKVQNISTEIPYLRQQLDGLLEERNEQKEVINLRDSIINKLEQDVDAFHKLADEAVIENEKLHKQIALYIDPLKELENDNPKEPDLLSTDRRD